jgi:hypothetical membrane protein
MTETPLPEQEQRRERAVSTHSRDIEGTRRLAGGVFFALGAGFLTVVMLAAAMVPGYDFRNGAISDLGVAPETALVFNGLLVLAGIANIAGGYLLYRMHGRRWLLGTFVLAGIGAVVTGVFPLDTGAPHSLGALFAFVFFNLQALGLATRLTGVLQWLSALAGALGLVFVVVMVVGDAGNTAVFGPFGHGGTERLIVYPVMLWLVALGGYLLGGGSLTGTAVGGR